MIVRSLTVAGVLLALGIACLLGILIGPPINDELAARIAGDASLAGLLRELEMEDSFGQVTLFRDITSDHKYVWHRPHTVDLSDGFTQVERRVDFVVRLNLERFPERVDGKQNAVIGPLRLGQRC